MRALATRLGVVPAALYRHVTSKEQLYDLILDGVLAEVDCQAELPAFLRSLPASRFPALAAVGAYAWADDRDQRFTASLDTLIAGLQATLRPRTHDAPCCALGALSRARAQARQGGR